MAKSQHKINESLFFNITMPEVAYFLGYLWADGYVSKSGYLIILTIAEADMLNVMKSFKNIGEWTFRPQKRRKPHHQDQIMMSTSNKYLNKFLQEHDYKSKSFVSACKILSKIPEHLRHYWFRGLFDGDGCFYLNEKTRDKEAFVASSYEQDWSFFTSLLDNMGIVYELRKFIGKIGKGSTVRITKGYGIKRFGDYIYKNYEIDKIGLFRKYNKFLILKNYISKERNSNAGEKTSKYIGVRKVRNKFKVIMKINQELMSFCFFDKEKDAALFYDKIAKFEFGDRINLNENVFKEDFEGYSPEQTFPSKDMSRVKYQLYKEDCFIGNFISIQEMADFIGVNRITLSRSLKKTNQYKDYNIKKEIYCKYNFEDRKSNLDKIMTNTSYGLKNAKTN